MAEYGIEQTVIVDQTTGCVHAFTKYAIDLSRRC